MIGSPPPTPLVHVESAQLQITKVGTGRKAKKQTRIVVDFSGALNATAAQNADAYELALILKTKASGKGKHRKPATLKLGDPLPVESAIYSGSSDTVTLVPLVTPVASLPEELIVNGALLTDTLGRAIDGANDGQAGSNYVGTIAGNQVTPGGIESARAKSRATSIAKAVDYLLAKSHLAEATQPWPRVRHSLR